MLLPRLKLDAATRFELVSPKGLSLLQSAGYPILPRSDNKLVRIEIIEISPTTWQAVVIPLDYIRLKWYPQQESNLRLTVIGHVLKPTQL